MGISCLSKDVLILTFQNLSPSSIKNARLTCKKWNEFLSDDNFWKSFYSKYFPNNDLTKSSEASFRELFKNSFLQEKNITQSLFHCEFSTALPWRDDKRQRLMQNSFFLVPNEYVLDTKTKTTLTANIIELFAPVKHNKWLLQTCFTPDNCNPTIHVLNPTTREFNGAHVTPISCSAKKGNLIASGAEDGDISIWDIEKQTSLRTIRGNIDNGHTDRVSAIALGKDLVFSAADDGSIKIWDMSGKFVKKINHSVKISSLSYSKDILFIVDEKNEVFFWKYAVEDKLEKIEFPLKYMRKHPVNIAVSLDNNVLFVLRDALYCYKISENQLKLLNVLDVEGIHLETNNSTLVVGFEAKNDILPPEITFDFSIEKDDHTKLLLLAMRFKDENLSSDDWSFFESFPDTTKNTVYQCMDEVLKKNYSSYKPSLQSGKDAFHNIKFIPYSFNRIEAISEAFKRLNPNATSQNLDIMGHFFEKSSHH